MKVMWRNKQSFSYCLYDHDEEILDEYLNSTGERKVVYKDAVSMSANISPAGGQEQVEMFGNLDKYDKVIVTDDMNCPIDESTVLFIDKQPEYDDDKAPVYDYIVRRVAKSLNSISIAVRKVEVSGVED